jgi:CheY-like chemotaxis protein
MCSDSSSSRSSDLAAEQAVGDLAAPVRVLVVDDRRDSAFAMQKLLELDGHLVHVAADGTSGVELARRFKPQLVLCDINLPGEMTGYDVARTLRDDPSQRSVYLVAVTGYSGEQFGEAAAEAGFECHLTKPIGQIELRALVTALRARAERRT